LNVARPKSAVPAVTGKVAGDIRGGVFGDDAAGTLAPLAACELRPAAGAPATDRLAGAAPEEVADDEVLLPRLSEYAPATISAMTATGASTRRASGRRFRCQDGRGRRRTFPVEPRTGPGGLGSSAGGLGPGGRSLVPAGYLGGQHGVQPLRHLVRHGSGRDRQQQGGDPAELLAERRALLAGRQVRADLGSTVPGHEAGIELGQDLGVQVVHRPPHVLSPPCAGETLPVADRFPCWANPGESPPRRCDR
jgi:hypothetical protein